MKIVNKGMQRLWASGLVLSALALPAVAQDDSPPVQPPPATAQVSVTFSRGVNDILKMLDAKVDPAVIRAYINNSTTAFNPTAQEIIGLKRRGVPDELITAMIQRGAEVRTLQAQQAQAMAPMTPPAGGAPYASGYTAPAPYNDVDYGYGYPAYDYPYVSYAYPYYGYPYNYWWYNSWYPWSYFPFYFGYYGHHWGGFHDGFHRFNRFDGFHRFNGGHSFARGSVRAGAWSPVRGGFAFRSQGSFAGRSGGFAGRPAFGGHMGGGFVGHSGGFSGSRTGGFTGGHGGGGFGGGHGGGHR
jgi:hypothetical protein